MGAKMKAYILAAPQRYEAVWKPIPQPGPRQALIRLLVCGTCASEYFPWQTGEEIGRVYGHEGVGVIEAVGPGMTKFRVGDRVTGMMHECFAEYTLGDEDEMTKVPDGLSDEQAIGEPLAMLMSGVNHTPIELGQTFAIVGTGYMGLGFLQLACAKGAGKVIAVDMRDQGLENARRFGATETYHSNEVPAEYIVDVWDDSIFDRGVPVVAEVTGNEAALQLAGDMTAVHGHLAVAGYHQGGMRSVNMALWNWKAITVRNAHERRSWLCPGLIDHALALVQKKVLDTAGMMTNEYGLDELNRALYEIGHKPDGYIKGFIRIGNM